MRYYSTQRPIVPGSVPGDGLTEVHSFEFCQYVPEIDREAYGWAEYDRRLLNYEIDSYELTPAGMRIWWSVITSEKDGKTTARLGPVSEAVEQPTRLSKSSGGRVTTMTWLTSREAAERLVDDLRN